MVRSSPAAGCTITLQTILVAGYGLLGFFQGVRIVFAQLTASQIHAKKGLHELDFSLLWSMPGRKKSLFLHEATGTVITARRYRAGKGATCFGCRSPWKGTEDLVPSALFEHRQEHTFGSGVASVNRC